MKPYYDQDGITIYHGDCREVLPALAFDVVVTDPPYGTGCAPRGGATAGSLDSGSGFTPHWDKWAPEWMSLVATPAAVFCPVRRMREVMEALGSSDAVFYVKSNPSPLGTSIEPCVLRGFTWAAPQHVVAYNAANGQQHPTQKPEPVMRFVVSRAPVGVVCDPFMGSGTTLRVAKDDGRRAIGIEIEERYCEIAAKRLAQGVLPFG